MNAENNDLHEEMIEADSEAAAKTLVAATEVQDHHIAEEAVEAEDATSVTAADEIEVTDAAEAVAVAVKTGDQTTCTSKLNRTLNSKKSTK